MAVSDAVGLFAVRHNVDRAGDGDDRARLFGKCLGERDRAVKILLAHLVRDVSVHALGRAAAGGKGLDLGDVTADDSELDLFEELLRRLGAKLRSTRAHGVARLPARNIDSIVRLLSVPMLMFNPPQIVVISSTSLWSSDMMGDAPQASTMLAQSFTVT